MLQQQGHVRRPVDPRNARQQGEGVDHPRRVFGVQSFADDPDRPLVGQVDLLLVRVQTAQPNALRQRRHVLSPGAQHQRRPQHHQPQRHIRPENDGVAAALPGPQEDQTEQGDHRRLHDSVQDHPGLGPQLRIHRQIEQVERRVVNRIFEDHVAGPRHRRRPQQALSHQNGARPQQDRRRQQQQHGHHPEPLQQAAAHEEMQHPCPHPCPQAELPQESHHSLAVLAEPGL